MKRRDFLKLIGAASVVVAAPLSLVGSARREQARVYETDFGHIYCRPSEYERQVMKAFKEFSLGVERRIFDEGRPR